MVRSKLYATLQIKLSTVPPTALHTPPTSTLTQGDNYYGKFWNVQSLNMYTNMVIGHYHLYKHSKHHHIKDMPHPFWIQTRPSEAVN